MVNQIGQTVIEKAIIGAITKLGTALKFAIVESSFNLALFGVPICLIFYICGWQKGSSWAVILVVAHLIIRVLLGV